VSVLFAASLASTSSSDLPVVHVSFTSSTQRCTEQPDRLAAVPDLGCLERADAGQP
jgi:hypothetical protein